MAFRLHGKGLVVNDILGTPISDSGEFITLTRTPIGMVMPVAVSDMPGDVTPGKVMPRQLRSDTIL